MARKDPNVVARKDPKDPRDDAPKIRKVKSAFLSIRFGQKYLEQDGVK